MRILGLVLSLAIIAFLAYFMLDKTMSPPENAVMKEGDTILDTVDYAEDVVLDAELSACLRLCAVDFEKQATCEAECNQKYK